MKASDSRECCNCHSFEATGFHEQLRKGRMKMKRAMQEGQTCIDCHQGIAHQLPEGWDEEKA
jgi:nitrate/TMAO reductase-like tetraheme cytochrome c subunit